ncbi:cytochrome P450 4C1 [Anabrus simplex]|uniref:cytochrome P450 4C1 n=1 Tax=Anabrus simplex TaxID=316456 RepID=UPI0035A2F94D
MTVLCALLILICGVLYCYQQSRERKRKLAALLPGKLPLPIIGNALHFRDKSTFKVLLKVIDRYGPTCKFWLGSKLFVLITSPEDVKTVLLNSDSVTRDQFMMSVLRPFTGDGLITSSGNTWKQHRRIMRPVFHSKILLQYVPVFHRNAKILTDSLADSANGLVFNVYPYIAECTLNMICETALGTTPSKLNPGFAKSFLRGLHIIEERIARPWLLINWLFRLSKLGQEQDTIMKMMDNTTNHEISKLLRSQTNISENNRAEEDSITNSLNVLVKSTGRENSIVNEEFLRDEINTLLIAGQETTATIMSFALVLLGIHQDIQETVYKELQDIFQDDPSAEITINHLNQMKQLDCVLKETLRLFPAAPIVTRELSKETDINNYTLPAGCTALIVSYKAHRNPQQFPNPEHFDPARFSPEAHHPYAYIPFGGGPKICIGQKYAMIQMKTVLSHVLRHYKVFPGCTRESLQDLQMGMVLRPTSGFRLALQVRKYVNTGELS